MTAAPGCASSGGARAATGSTPPIAARSHDLASVRAGIARTLVHPPNARRDGLQGKVLVEFVLLDVPVVFRAE